MISRWLNAFLCAALVGTTVLAQPEAPGPKTHHILILYSFSQDFLPFSAVARVFKEELPRQIDGPIAYHELSLETARFGEAEVEQPVVDYLRALLANRPLDLVLPVGSPAVQFVLRHRDALFPNIPMVATAMDARRLNGFTLTANDTALSVSLDPAGVVSNLLALLPATTNIAVVLGSTPVERAWALDFDRDFAPFKNRVRFSFLNDQSLAQMCETVSRLHPNSAVLFGMLAVDAAGVPHRQERCVQQLSTASSAPFFGMLEYQIGRGVIGGAMHSTRQVGQETAEVVAHILGGASPASHRPQPIPRGNPVFDWRELKRWGIAESQLPPGSRIEFRQISLWARYGWIILGLISALLLQAALITALLIQRKRTRETLMALRRSTADMQTLQEIVGHGSAMLILWRAEGAAWTAQWASTNVERLLGIPAQALGGGRIRWHDLIHEDDARYVADEVAQYRARGAREWTLEYRVVTRPGPTLWVRDSIQVSPHLNPNDIHLQSLMLDITAEKRSESEVQELRHELMHAGRIATLGELTASFAHELNQPLTAILTNAQAAQRFLSAEPPGIEDVRDCLRDIIADDNRAGDTIRRLRDLAHKRASTLTPLDINSLAHDTVSLLQSDARSRDIDLTFEPAPLPIPANGDHVQLKQVMLNLVLNAFDAVHPMPSPNRVVTVRTCHATPDTVQVSVHDRGAGIPAEKMSRLFEPFFTTKPTGLGLGLSISRSIVEAHHGRLWAESEPGRGTHFHFTLPIPVQGGAGKEEHDHAT